MIHWAPVHLEFLLWCGTIATLVISTCCRAKQFFVSDCLQTRSLYSAGKWFPKFTDFRKLVLPSRTLSTAIEVAGLVGATLDGLIEVTFHAQAIVEFLVPGIFFNRTGHAVTNSYTVDICFLTLSNVFACCAEDKLHLTSVILSRSHCTMLRQKQGSLFVFILL